MSDCRFGVSPVNYPDPDPDPRFPPFLPYVRCKSGVTFIRRSFRDVKPFNRDGHQCMEAIEVSPMMQVVQYESKSLNRDLVH